MEDTRADKGLAFMLQYENVAWYDAGTVKILDRRVYPRNVEFVTCRTHVEVMQAIRDMVTQSAGPYTAAGMGMALAAWECREKPEKEQLAFLQQAAACIADARPTTKKRMEQVCTGCLAAAEQALKAGTRVDEAIRAHVFGFDVPAEGNRHDPMLRRDDCGHDAERSEKRRENAAAVLPGDETLFSGRAPDCHGLP